MTCYYPSRQHIVPELKSLCKSFRNDECDFHNKISSCHLKFHNSDDNFDNNEKNLDETIFSPESLSMVSDMKYEENRLKSFERGWPLSYIKPQDCASIGLFYLGSEDRVMCAFCNGVISNWDEGDTPIAEHVKYFPMCPFLLRQDVGNVPISGRNGLQMWQIHNARPERFPLQYSIAPKLSTQTSQSTQTKHPTMSSFDKRLQTFGKWPGNQSVAKITPSNLAESGLFYTGVSDIVTCFCCGGQMSNWCPTDDPWIEHAKHFSNCAFVKSIKGTAFIEHAKCNHGPESAEFIQIQEPSTSRNSPQNNPQQENYANICNKLETMEIEQNHEGASSNGKFMCKICMEVKTTRVAFYPCGHSLTCPTCAQELKTCPLCRKSIEAVMKLYLD